MNSGTDLRINRYMKANGLTQHEAWTLKALLRMDDLLPDHEAQKARFHNYLKLRASGLSKRDAIARAVTE